MSTATPTPLKPMPDVVAERVGTRTYRSRNSRGAEVTMGPEALEGAFTPGELLAVAIAGCTGMSADSRIASDLGEDVAITVTVTRHKNEAENRYDELTVNLTIQPGPNAQPQQPERAKRTIAAAHRAIDALCTVSRTVEHGPGIAVVVAPADPPA